MNWMTPIEKIGHNIMRVAGGSASAAPRSAAAVALVAFANGATAQSEPIAIEMLTERHAFTDDVFGQIVLGAEGLEQKTITVEDFSTLATARITLQPGAMFPWHTHAGPVLVPVTEGALVYVFAEDCVERSYPAGTAFVDPGNTVHTAMNPSDSEEAVVIATFLGATEDGPLTIPVDADQAATLNEICRFDAG